MDKNMSDEPQFAEAELARVADGSLEAAHEAEVRRRLEGSPELTAALGEQERTVAMLRSLDVEAPASARAAWGQQLRAAQPKPRRRLRLRLGFALPATTAVAGALAVILVAGGGTTGPTLAQTVRVTLAAATYPAPAERDTATLRAAAAGISFPYWQKTVGWRAVGARTDRIDGRYVQTVFYGWRGSRVGYAIVSGAAVPVHGRPDRDARRRAL